MGQIAAKFLGAVRARMRTEAEAIGNVSFSNAQQILEEIDARAAKKEPASR